MYQVKKIIQILLILSLVVVAYFLFSYVYGNIRSELFLEINNSIISMIFGGIVTVLLLSQQSSSEEKKEKNIEIYKIKSELYNNFFETIWSAWQDEKLDYGEITELLKLLKRISMFLDDNDTYTLSKLVNELISTNNSSNKEEKTKIVEIERIFSDITTILKNDLGIKASNIRGNKYQEMIKINKENLEMAKQIQSKVSLNK